ncbi:MAG: thioredoxin domain-containing protein [Armatimonadota bacterium]|nr:thioredoxin domain-containing protein [Armatimonadota bacterium]MDR7450671.1 thioredoxin domain-containing protein [Armatimonadota bacterium]MDR7466027.1 thioredoxin domain-containing protein [Armatimonadota bacterium]MDR7493936.1 thioredoxin domain-containing protein [Armatimonadota bacterium]MDR7504041.1 thioredoxin domain-containing protein [Armatimonadota bacterium]
MSPNRLADARSAYLRGAAHQPVAWLPWSEEAFRRARTEDKPILLDIGAVWCHWCHVIDQESYDDPDVARIINEHFVPIKVDRDERPDIDARYQNAVSAITGQGGWPLTAFLTPDGKVFFGGTYFPKDDAYGRPGFRRVLLSVAAYYRDRRDEAVGAAEQLHRQLAAVLAGPQAGGPLDPGHLETALASIRRLYDPVEGGFGGAPKFPHPSTLAFLLRVSARTGQNDFLEMAVRTLEKMARGGIHDQLGGGFHRYATDARWIVPHFEKMLPDNAGLLANYAQAFQATGHPLFAAVARDTATFMAAVLADPRQGGFFGSQDADAGPGDDGGYFTWTEAEAKEVLSADEFTVLAEHYHLRGRGEMPGDGRHVLFVDRDTDVVAALTGRPVEEVHTLLASGRRKLAEARSRRPAPYVDTACYANWNGLAISAFLTASAALDEPAYRDPALRSLERFIAEGYAPGRGFVHVLGGDGLRLADDQVQMAQALLDAYEVTGRTRYLRIARDVTDAALRDFWEDPGFRDAGKSDEAGLSTPYRPLQDSPTPSPNGVGALVLLRLSRLLGLDGYRSLAARLLAAFVPGLAPHAVYASTLFIALDHLLYEPAHIAIVGAPDDPRTQALHGAALRAWRPGRLISHHRADGEEDVPVPEAARAMLGHARVPTAFVCAGAFCAPPVTTPQALVETLAAFRGS